MKKRGRPSNKLKPSSISLPRPSSVDSDSALEKSEDSSLLLENGLVKKLDLSLSEASLNRIIDNLPMVSIENDLLRKFKFLAFLWREGSDGTSSPRSSISTPSPGSKKPKQIRASSPLPKVSPPAKRPRSSAQFELDEDYSTEQSSGSSASSRHVSIPKSVPKSAQDVEQEEQIKKFMKLYQDVEEMKRASNEKRDLNQNALTR